MGGGTSIADKSDEELVELYLGGLSPNLYPDRGILTPRTAGRQRGKDKTLYCSVQVYLRHPSKCKGEWGF